jgi:hypothetical protein
MTITICSSVDFSPKIIEIKKELEKIGYATNIPYFTQKMIDGEISYEDYVVRKEKEGDILMREVHAMDMIKRYWNYIKNSDAILVVNESKKGIDGYIGGSVLMEMAFAYGFGKKIFLLNPPPARGERMHYLDEIMDMKPVVINGNLSELKI